MIYLDNAATSFPKPESGLPGTGPLRPDQPGEPGTSRSPHGRRRRANARCSAARAQPVLSRRGPERWIFTLNCTDGLNLAIKGIIQPGDHVVTTDLEHNSISRPLQALAKSGVISLTACRLGRRLRRPSGDSRGDHRQDVTGRHDARLQRAGNRAARSRRSPRVVREAGAFFLVDAAQSAGVVPIDLRARGDRPAGLPGPQGPCTARQARGHFMSARAPTASFAPGAREEPAATHRARPSRFSSLTFWRGVRPTCWASPGWPRASPGSPNAGRTNLSRHEVALLQHVVDWAEDSGCWRIAGRWDPETHVAPCRSLPPSRSRPRTWAGSLTPASKSPSGRVSTAHPYIHRALGSFPEGTLRLSPGPFTTADDI